MDNDVARVLVLVVEVVVNDGLHAVRVALLSVERSPGDVWHPAAEMRVSESRDKRTGSESLRTFRYHHQGGSSSFAKDDPSVQVEHSTHRLFQFKMSAYLYMTLDIDNHPLTDQRNHSIGRSSQLQRRPRRYKSHPGLC